MQAKEYLIWDRQFIMQQQATKVKCLSESDLSQQAFVECLNITESTYKIAIHCIFDL